MLNLFQHPLFHDRKRLTLPRHWCSSQYWVAWSRCSTCPWSARNV